MLASSRAWKKLLGSLRNTRGARGNYSRLYAKSSFTSYHPRDALWRRGINQSGRTHSGNHADLKPALYRGCAAASVNQTSPRRFFERSRQ
jgi:hypothetical protein